MKNILFINHAQKQCGVYQYGKRTAYILGKSTSYNIIYSECESESQLVHFINEHNPVGIIYNYHPSTIGWVNIQVIQKFSTIVHYGIHHEGNATESVGFNFCIDSDSTRPDAGNTFSVPRPISEFNLSKTSNPKITTIGSFGFGFNNKGFERLVKLINDEFDQAIINLHIPFAFYGDQNGVSARNIAALCSSHIKKENIKLNVTHNFLSDLEILNFLSSHTLNAFLYDEMGGRGLSSVIDYALGVNVPIAITKSYMFRHISSTSPSICIEDRSLNDIIQSGNKPLLSYREKWSNINLLNKYQLILNKTIK